MENANDFFVIRYSQKPKASPCAFKRVLELNFRKSNYPILFSKVL